jgi:hypothetical protein
VPKSTALDEGRAVFEAMAKAAHYNEQAWRELDAVLPQVRDKFPGFYENMLHLIIASFQNHQLLEGAGDDLKYVLLDKPNPRLLLPTVVME